MKKEFELSKEDLVVMDMIDTAPSNNEMSPYFIFYYKKLHPDEDLEESLIELFEEAKKQPSEIYGEDWLYDAYKNYPRLYLILLPWTWTKGNYSHKMKSFCYDIRKYIFENEFDEFLSELTEAHKDKSIVFRKYWTQNKDNELISELKVLKDESTVLPEDRMDEYGLLEAFWKRPCSQWSPNDIIYSPFQLGKLIVKFWNTEFREDVKCLLNNMAQNVGNEEYYQDEDNCEIEGELEYHSKIFDDIRNYPLDDIANHISEPNIRSDVELFFKENMWLEMRRSYKESEFISDTDFMEKALNSKYGTYLTGGNSHSSRNDDARLRELFSKRDDMIERILNISDVKQQIYLLMCIGTEKSRKAAWNIVTKSNSSEYYVHILNVCGECFQLKYIRKEILKKNPLCIDGIWESINEKAVRFLFAILWKNIVMGEDTSLLEIKNVVALRTEFRHYYFYSMVNSLSGSLTLYMLYIYAILHLKENDGAETSDNLRIISKDEYLSAHYGMKTSNDLWIIFENNDYSWFHSFDLFYEMLTKNNFLSKNLKNLIALRDSSSQQDKRLIHSLLMALSENKEIEQEDMNKYEHIFAKTHEGFDIFRKAEVYENSDVSQIRARVILNANYVIPEYFGYAETERNMEQLLQPKEKFHWFERSRKAEQFLYSDKMNLSLAVNKMLWKEYWKDVIIKEQLEIYRKRPIYPFSMSIPIEPEYEEYILSRTDDIFASALDTLMVQEFKYFLLEQRKKNISALKKEGFFDNDEEAKLLEWIKKADHYGLSDRDIIDCLSEDKTDEWWKVVHTRLEAEFMNHIFAKCLLWVIKFDKSELWENAPWWGMKIFSKSFIDRPRVWATQLLKILNEELEKKELLRVCFALGHLREPLLEGLVPKELKRIAEKQNPKTKEIILRQYSLFNRKNLKMGKHTGNEKKRVEKCCKELLKISQKRFK